VYEQWSKYKYKVITVKDLGIIFLKDLTFTEHINKTCNKTLRVFGFLKRNYWEFNDLRDLSTTTCLRVLYFTLIRFILEYGSLI